MDKRKKLMISIIIVLLLVVTIGSSTYAFILAITNEEEASTGSGMLGINYEPPADIGGTLIPSSDRSGGLFTSTTASLETESQAALFNMYITPTALNKLNITALKWEAEGLRDTNDDGVLDMVCSDNGNFSTAEVGTAIKIINGCELDYDDTIFNIYIWLDSSILNTSLEGATFGATIGADSVDITGTYDGLPDIYQEIEYIEFTGTQYIDTGIVPTNHMVEVKYDSETYNNDEHLFGTAVTSSAKYFHFTLYNNKYYWGLNGSESNGGAWSTGIKRLLYNYGDNHEIIQNGIVLGSGSNIASTANLTLARRSKTSFQGKYYYFKVTDRATGLLVRNMIPCYRNSDGVIGMYDTVNGIFYTNAGTGDFKKGNDV